jgi:hypothetical protein
VGYRSAGVLRERFVERRGLSPSDYRRAARAYRPWDNDDGGVALRFPELADPPPGVGRKDGIFGRAPAGSPLVRNDSLSPSDRRVMERRRGAHDGDREQTGPVHPDHHRPSPA